MVRSSLAWIYDEKEYQKKKKEKRNEKNKPLFKDHHKNQAREV